MKHMSIINHKVKKGKVAIVKDSKTEVSSFSHQICQFLRFCYFQLARKVPIRDDSPAA